MHLYTTTSVNVYAKLVDIHSHREKKRHLLLPIAEASGLDLRFGPLETLENGGRGRLSVYIVVRFRSEMFETLVAWAGCWADKL